MNKNRARIVGSTDFWLFRIEAIYQFCGRVEPQDSLDL